MPLPPLFNPSDRAKETLHRYRDVTPFIHVDFTSPELQHLFTITAPCGGRRAPAHGTVLRTRAQIAAAGLAVTEPSQPTLPTKSMVSYRSEIKR